VIFKGPHILIQVSSFDLTSKFVVTFRYGTQEEELGVVEWPPFGNKGLHFLPGHS
jgi:hypothetical protein